MNIPVTGSPRIDFSPSHILKRRPASWLGLEAETVEFIEPQTYEYEFQAPCHMLIAPELSRRYDGETALEGLPKSNLRDLTRKLTFVPAGSRFHGWQKPSVLSRVNFFYIDPRGPLLDPELRFGATEFKPRLFFFDADLWGTALKLKAQIDRQELQPLRGGARRGPLPRADSPQRNLDRSATPWRPRALATETCRGLYRGATRFAHLRRRNGRARTLEPVSFLARLQGKLRSAAASLSHEPARRGREEPAGRHGDAGDRDRAAARVQ